MRFFNCRIFFYQLTILFLFFSCKRIEDKNPESVILNRKDTIDSKAVVIKGTTDDSKAFNYLNFINYSYFNGTNHDQLISREIEGKTQFILDSINQPQIIELFSFGDSTNYNTRIFVSPGDTVLMAFNKKNIDFKGNNAAHYFFFKELDSANNEWASNKYVGDIQDYKKRVDAIYKRRQKFLDDYIMENPVSEDFVEHISSELKFEYLYNLIAPRSVATEMGFSVNNHEFIALFSRDSDVEKEGFLNLRSYFDSITIEDFQRPELLKNDYFKRSLVSFIRYYFVNPDFLNYSVENFEAEREFIQNNLEGELKEYALTRLIYDYHKKGFGQGKQDNQLVKMLLREQKAKNTNQSLKEVLSSIEESLNAVGHRLPEEKTNDLLITLRGDTLMFNEILKKAPAKIKVLDFWASWCSPCLVEIRQSQALREELENRYGLEWIFISVDSNFNNWKLMSKKLQPYLKDKNQYRILDAGQSEILKFLANGSTEAFMVPRYVIIDSNQEIIASQAPRPSDSLVFKNLIKKIMN